MVLLLIMNNFACFVWYSHCIHFSEGATSEVCGLVTNKVDVDVEVLLEEAQSRLLGRKELYCEAILGDPLTSQFRCRLCQRVYRYKRNLFAHLRSIHNAID